MLQIDSELSNYNQDHTTERARENKKEKQIYDELKKCRTTQAMIHKMQTNQHIVIQKENNKEEITQEFNKIRPSLHPQEITEQNVSWVSYLKKSI